MTDTVTQALRLDGYNGAISQAIRALRYLAENSRPIEGERFPNSACCYQVANELERTLVEFEPAITAWNTRAAPSGEGQGWIVGNADGTKWRTWGSVGPEWTDDREQATRYARRVDAERTHADDEDAWHIVPYSGEGRTAGEAGSAIDDIAAERRRQIEAEGWTPEHDDAHSEGDLSRAAACYAAHASAYQRVTVPLSAYQSAETVRDEYGWPWAKAWWKPSTPRRDLVKAGALIVAEIERIDRAAEAPE